jgi:hypothetical protein
MANYGDYFPMDNPSEIKPEDKRGDLFTPYTPLDPSSPAPAAPYDASPSVSDLIGQSYDPKDYDLKTLEETYSQLMARPGAKHDDALKSAVQIAQKTKSEMAVPSQQQAPPEQPGLNLQPMGMYKVGQSGGGSNSFTRHGPKDLPEKVEAASGMQAAATKEMGQAQAIMAGESANATQANIAQENAATARAQAEQAGIRAQVADQRARNEALLEKIDKQSIDPNRIFSGKEGSVRGFAALAGIALSGLGQAFMAKAGRDPGKNGALEIINAAVDRDIQAQVAELSKKKFQYQAGVNLVADFMREGESLRNATELARAARLGQFANQMQLIKQRAEAGQPVDQMGPPKELAGPQWGPPETLSGANGTGSSVRGMAQIRADQNIAQVMAEKNNVLAKLETTNKTSSGSSQYALGATLMGQGKPMVDPVTKANPDIRKRVVAGVSAIGQLEKMMDTYRQESPTWLSKYGLTEGGSKFRTDLGRFATDYSYAKSGATTTVEERAEHRKSMPSGTGWFGELNKASGEYKAQGLKSDMLRTIKGLIASEPSTVEIIQRTRPDLIPLLESVK